MARKVIRDGILSFMAKVRLSTLFLIVLLTAGCKTGNPSEITLNVVNKHDLASTGDLEIKVCADRPIELSELAVTISVSENKDWSNLADVKPYETYFDSDFVGVPGTIRRRLPLNYWSPPENGCYTARVNDAFVHTEDWAQHLMCPFKAIIVVAAYQKGVINEAEIFECEVPARVK